jgi:hypothetical protein
MPPVGLRKKKVKSNLMTRVAQVLSAAVVLLAVWLVVAPDRTRQLAKPIRVLEAWARKHNVQYPNAEVRYDPKYDGYGLYATANYKRGDAILIVPRDAVLNLEHMRASGFAKYLEPSFAMGLSHTVIMGMWVSWAFFEPEAQNDPVVRKFKPYLDSFPDGNNQALMWSTAEIARSAVQLKLPGLHVGLYPVLVNNFKIADKQSKTGPVWHRADGTLPEFLRDSNFFFGQAMSASRAFGDLPHKNHAADDIARKFSNLIPIGGLMNHEPTNQGMRIMNGDEDKVWFAAGRDIKAGEEIFNAYGSASFIKMAPQYGFMDPFSPLDAMQESFTFPTFPLDPKIVDAFTITPISHLHQGADPEQRARNRYMVDYFQHNVTSLLPFTRIGLFASTKKHINETTQDQRDSITRRALCRGKPNFKTCGISRTNEAQAVRRVLEHLEHLRNEYAKPLGQASAPIRPEAERIAGEIRARAVLVLNEMLAWVNKNSVYAEEDIASSSGLLVAKA